MPFIIITMLISFVAAIFALQNAEVVPVKFMFLQQEASLALVIIGSVFLGLLLGTSFVMYIKFRNFWEGRKTSETLKQLTDENVLLAKKVEELEALLARTNSGASSDEPEVGA